MKAHAGAIDQFLSADMTTAECSTGCCEPQHDDGRETGKECAVVFRFDHAVHGKSSGSHCKAQHGWGMEAWRTLFQACSPKNNARLVVIMLEVLAFPLDTNDVVNSLETMELKIKEIRENRNSGIPEDWHRDSSSRRRTDENASHHELAQVGNIPGHQNGGDKRHASPECSEGEIGRLEQCSCRKKVTEFVLESIRVLQ